MKNDNHKRRNFLIDKKFQKQFMIKFSGLIIINAVLTLLILFILQQSNFTWLPGGDTVLISYDASKSIPVKKINNNKYQLEEEEPDDYIISKEQNTYDSFALYWKVILLISLLNIVIILLFTLFFSHSMAGPIYRIKRTLKEVIQGKKVEKITLRKRDQFVELAELINKTVIKKHEK